MPNEPPDPLDVIILNILRAVVVALETSPSSPMRSKVLGLVQQAISASEKAGT